MKVIIEFETDNAAFADDIHGEIEQILEQAGTKVLMQMGRNHYVDAEGPSDKLIDTNGNTVGTVELEET